MKRNTFLDKLHRKYRCPSFMSQYIYKEPIDFFETQSCMLTHYGQRLTGTRSDNDDCDRTSMVLIVHQAPSRGMLHEEPHLTRVPVQR